MEEQMPHRTRATMDGYQMEEMPNGWVRVMHLRSRLVGLWYPDGRPRHGSLTHSVDRAHIGSLVEAIFG